ncbi:MAG: BlaI/MecI/CopY family transcriptional regulator [Candidatus Amulumruptor sp.]|nr:BlaI/MecI/CopY family transcriptional regulator [Candidatus Amulumruptor sp.]
MRPKNVHPRLTERESEIMSLLWEHGPMFVRDMLEYFPEPRPQFNTVATFVRGLEDKGWVAHEAVGNRHRFYAVAVASDFGGNSLMKVIRNFFRGSASAAVSALVADEQLSIDELKDIIRMVEQHHDASQK